MKHSGQRGTGSTSKQNKYKNKKDTTHVDPRWVSVDGAKVGRNNDFDFSYYHRDKEKYGPKFADVRC